MKSRFEPDPDPIAAAHPAAKLVDPEAYDASEQQFAASLEEKPVSPPPRFVADQPEERIVSLAEDLSAEAEPSTPPAVAASAAQEPVQNSNDANAWRDEVAAKVSHYRARRRPRAPRYPSLQLPFDPPEAPCNRPYEAPQPAQTASRLAVAMQDIAPLSISDTSSVQVAPVAPDVSPTPPDAGAKILEFPRSWAAPAAIFDELAEPVFERPRILEAPEVQPPPPALGGMLIEPAEEPVTERRPGFELPLQPAPMSRRIAAGAIDALLVAAALALFAYTFFRITSVVPSWRLALGPAAAVSAAFWAGYQYLLLVYAGTTPGLKLAKLQLSQFDGSAVPRNLRRWRVLASVLSALSLALGYAWCFLDEDELCWHDRITHTYMAPGKGLKRQPDRVGMS